MTVYMITVISQTIKPSLSDGQNLIRPLSNNAPSQE